MSVQRLPAAIRQYLEPEDGSSIGGADKSGHQSHVSDGLVPGTVKPLFPKPAGLPGQSGNEQNFKRASSGGGRSSSGRGWGAGTGGWSSSDPHKGEWKRIWGPWTEAVGRAERMNSNEGDKSLGAVVAGLPDSVSSCLVNEIDGREFAEKTNKDLVRLATATTAFDREWGLKAVGNDFQSIAEQAGCPDLSEEHMKTLWKTVAYLKHSKDQMTE